METIKVRIKAETPLLMHSGRLADPLDPATKELKALTGKVKKTDADHEAIAKCEWAGGLYLNEDGPYIPACNLDACIKGAAKKQKLGTKFGAAVMVVEDAAKLVYQGPRDLDGMWKAGYRDVRGVVISNKRLMRCRPMFKNWSAEFTVAFDPRDVNRESVVQAISDAGRAIGLGDMRPQKGGRYGKFTAEVL